MDDGYEYPQIENVQSESGTLDDTYMHLSVVHPDGKRQSQLPTTTVSTTVKVVLGILGALVLVALAMAAVAVVMNQQQNEKIYNYTHLTKQHHILVKTMLEEVQVKLTNLNSMDLPQRPPTGTSPVAPTTTTATSTTSTSFSGSSSSTSPVATVPTTTSTTSPTTLSGTSPRSCATILSSDPSAPSGVYTIHVGGRVQGRAVWCDMVTDGGGWTRFQHRYDGSVEFNRSWSEYRSGFGSAGQEFWLGNEDLHRLTTAQPSELRVKIWDWARRHGNATYSSFSIGNESSNYRLYVSGYNGIKDERGDSLSIQNGRSFTTFDRNNEPSGNCYRWGWWYCGYSNLNGRYIQGGIVDYSGVIWYYWHGNGYSYKGASMMTRPRQ